jgi:hypothetical protein
MALYRSRNRARVLRHYYLVDKVRGANGRAEIINFARERQRQQLKLIVCVLRVFIESLVVQSTI